MEVGVEAKRGSVLEKMGSDILFIKTARHWARLIYTKQGQAIQNSWMDFMSSISNNTHNNLFHFVITKVVVHEDDDTHLFPSVGTPGLRVFAGTEMCDISHDAVHCPTKQNLVFLK